MPSSSKVAPYWASTTELFDKQHGRTAHLRQIPDGTTCPGALKAKHPQHGALRIGNSVSSFAGMRFAAFLGLSLATCVIAVPSPRSHHVVHEKRAAEPVQWSKTRRLEPDTVLPMRFGLTQRNMHRVEDLLMEVSHPESPKYGQHYSAAEVVDLFAPSAETIAAVTGWLTEAGIPKDRLRLSSNKAWIHLNATTAEAEELLNTEYHVYTHPSGDEQISRPFLVFDNVI